MFYTICDQPYTGAYPAKSVWLIGENELWIALDGKQIAKTVNEALVATIIVVSGSNGLFSYFNGYSWKHYINNELSYYSGRLLSVDIKQNVTVVVGWIDSRAIITIGRR